MAVMWADFYSATWEARRNIATQKRWLFRCDCGREYYIRGNAFIKRSLRPKEFIVNWKGKKHVPRLRKELLMNKAAALRYDGKAYYLMCQNIDGVNMSSLENEAQKAVVQTELVQHLTKLKTSICLLHGDCPQHNVVVDPETLPINAIVNWEHADFFPPALSFHFTSERDRQLRARRRTIR
ncbi:hypothetical protein QBC36DRAFT_366188 [Triangularia setosa]|uniref:Aminoglycoside phosphotransferase domain-containing protein n=1 Tax=Triangularia setosa TaxID=2587417 RepID=A0AAN7A2D3_9PEZI|nr:hypothetical protein QBC36DRAFT_366188 [Podospora setosa]